MKLRAFFVCLSTMWVTGSLAAQETTSWPQFRGVGGRALSLTEKPLPTDFGPDQNVRWKTPLPSGLSSPCIWGERIFLTGHDPKRKALETLCLDRRDGKILWRRTAPADKIESVYKVNSPASATPATDGRRVYVSFGSYGLVCYDLAGAELWRRPLPTPRTGFGSATSPIVAGDLVLLNGQGKDLHLLAVKADSGETVWTAGGNPFPSDYPAPFLWKHGDTTEVIVPGKGGLVAFDLKDGSRRWWLSGLSPETNCSPTAGDGLLFVASHLPGGDPDMRMTLPPFDELLEKYDKNKDGKLSRDEVPTDLKIFSRGGKDGIGDIHLHQMYWLFDKNGDGHIDRHEWQIMTTTPFNNSLIAIRPGGKNDISQTHVVWKHQRGIPEVPSPLWCEGRIYLVRNGGMLTCLDAKTGKECYKAQRLGDGGMFYASPVAGDGKIYICSDNGVVFVIKAGPRFELLAQNDLGESIRATPALVDGKIYLRTAGHLYAFGDREQSPAR